MPRSFTADLIDDRPGLAGRAFGFLPARRSDIVMTLIAIAASVAVLVNALALQTHGPATSSPAESAIPLPVPAPAEARRAAPTPSATPPNAAAIVSPPMPVAKPAVPKPAATPPASPKPAAKPSAAMPSSVGALAADVTGSIRPPGEVPASPRVLSVQKALAKLGYGPIRIDGRSGTATREAIERFERDRRLPISGEVSERLVRELTAVSGLSIE